MKAGYLLYLLSMCVLLGSCSSSRSYTEGYSIFPDPETQIGKTIRLVPVNTPDVAVDAKLESIAEEPEALYRERYKVFSHDPAKRDIAIGLGSEIFIIFWISKPTYHGVMSGYSPSGVLTSDSSGSHVYPFWEIDTLTEISTGKTLLREELYALVQDNVVPMRGLFHFSGYGDDAAKRSGITNSAFLRASTVVPVSPQAAVVNNDDGSSIVTGIVNGLLDAIFSSDNDSDKDQDKKEDSKKDAKKGRVSGEDRVKK